MNLDFLQTLTVIIFLVCALVFAWMQKPRLFWVGCVLTLEGGLGVWEMISFHYHGISLSETCGQTIAAHPIYGGISLVIFAIGFAALIIHLIIWGKISKRKKK
jgi:hypothetical protein